MAFDGIVTKAIASELQLLKGARIDKIFQPNSNTVIIGMYLNGSNYALNICINPSNYRINLTTHQKSNPKVAPNFCMVLRKHLIGLRLKNVITNSLERIITIELEGFDDVDDIISSKIIVELMGKHCNIILLNDEEIIIDCLRHINNESSTHIVVPHIKYLYPEINKKNFLDISNFQEFNSIIDTSNPLEFSNKISQTFNGISKKYIDFIIEKSATYVTNAVSHAQKLAAAGFRVYLIGGELKPTTEAVVGNQAILSLETLHFSKAFFGTNGVSLKAGFSTPDYEEAMVKKTAIGQAKKAYILADYSKFGNISSVTFEEFAKAQVITDRKPPEAFLRSKNIIVA